MGQHEAEGDNGEEGGGGAAHCEWCACVVVVG
jgi:hypothetical protein